MRSFISRDEEVRFSIRTVVATSALSLERHYDRAC